MKGYIKMLVIAFVAMLMSSCGVVRVHSDFDSSADFASYKTYAFHTKGIEKLKLNDLDKNRIIREIETQMAAKGMTKVSDSPDLWVNVLASSKEQVDVNQNNFWGWGWGPWWGGPNTSVNQYTSGTIIIDLVDEKRNILVWQGSGSGLNVSNLNKKAVRVPQAVEEILSKYPPEKR